MAGIRAPGDQVREGDATRVGFTQDRSEEMEL